MDSVVTTEQMEASRIFKEQLAKYQENEDAIQSGMYIRGTNPELDESIENEPRIREFLKQRREERTSFSESRTALLEIFGG
jgi:flagellum-specific ATP synthase